MAGFVGSPPINRLALARDREGSLAGGPFRFAGDWEFDAATLGVRPEDLALRETGPAADGPGEGRNARRGGTDLAGRRAAGSGAPPDFVAAVLRVEALGSEQRVHLDGPGEAGWVARVPPALRVAAGDRVGVSVAWERTHLFGPDGSRVGAAPGRGAGESL